MELALSLGDASKPFSLLDKNNPTKLPPNKDPLGFCIARNSSEERRGSSDPPIQLDLLPSTPVLRSQPSSHLRIPWLNDARTGYRTVTSEPPTRGAFDVNRFPLPAAEDTDDGAAISSQTVRFHLFRWISAENTIMKELAMMKKMKTVQLGRNSDSLKNNQLF
ncbi:homeobox-leucine zipper protein HOX11 [Sesbania bispinosa]|nr:homeobox-leucine zipper protein HOX11 [Sesbania bispinosa]